MALSPEDKTELADLIRTTFEAGCLCGHKEEVVHLIGRFETLGNGNASHGIESFAKTLAWMTAVRKLGEKVGGAVAVTVVIGAISGIGTLIYAGIKVLVGGWKP